MRAVLQGAALGALRSADLDLTPGRYVVLSNEPGTLESLVALLGGREAPRSGRVLLDGAAPASTPRLRQRIAALFEDESLPPAATTLASVGQVLLLRGDARTRAEEVLKDAGLSHLAALAPSALENRDLRAVALALALCHEQAELLVLHEPLSSTLPRATLLAALDRHTLRGATVVAATASSADASALGGEWLCIELGRLRAAPTPRLGVGPWQRVIVASTDASALARALHDAELELATELGVEPGTLQVTGSALDVTVHSVIRAAREHGIEIERIVPLPPPVEALLAARAGFARGAYEAARAAAHGVVPPAPALEALPPPAPSSYGGPTS